MAFSASTISDKALQAWPHFIVRLQQLIAGIKRKNRHLLVCAFICAALTSFVFTSSPLFASWQPPLTAAEQRDAAALALGSESGSISANNKTDGNLQRSAANTEIDITDLQREILLVELKHSKKNSNGRIAEVFIFDYPRGATELHRIDVVDNQVTEILPIDSVHLPLNLREQQVATGLLIQNEEVSENLEYEYLKVFGRTLANLDQLDMKVSIWQPLEHQRKSNTVANTCGEERCALVSVFTDDNYSFSLEPVVNLMRGTVHTEALR